jgi:hypothetical protein
VPYRRSDTARQRGLGPRFTHGAGEVTPHCSGHPRSRDCWRLRSRLAAAAQGPHGLQPAEAQRRPQLMQRCVPARLPRLLVISQQDGGR